MKHTLRFFGLGLIGLSLSVCGCGPDVTPKRYWRCQVNEVDDRVRNK